ncbi:MAG: EAL domain-containing protein [Eubacteriales bacterium]|nr:EAL domain-containing protein [Eubacteriales bacterium]
MDRMLKKELGLTKAHKMVMGLGLTALLTLSLFFCYRLYFNTREALRQHAIRSITNISQLNKDSVSRPITNRRVMLETVSARLEREGLEDVQDILDVLEGYRKVNDFYSIGVITWDRKLHLTNGRVADVSGTEFGDQVWDGRFHLSASYLPYAGGTEETNAFTYPVYQDGRIKYVLLATYLSRSLTERMNLSSMEGKGFNFIVDHDGAVVVYPHSYKNAAYNALMKHINETPSIIPSEGGDSHFYYMGERYYAHFEELGINEWYLMTCARESDVFAESYTLTQNSFMGLVLIWMVTALSVSAIGLSVYRSRKDLRKLAFYDELLGIGNASTLSVCFRKLPPERLLGMYLVLFDIDKFKEFNYIYGNENGDELLRYIVRVFQEVVPEVQLFRYGADCFVALDEKGGPQELAESIEKTLTRFSQDIAEGLIQPFDTSAGIRKVELGVPLHQLLSDAIIARDAIKGDHLHQYAFYEEAVRDRRLSYMEMESCFQEALRNNEFQVYYQPKYNMITGELIGAEALARWVKPDGRIISPGHFIPCFEESRQIILLDKEILRQTCIQMKEMEEDGIEVKPVSVNLSRIHLRNQGIVDQIETIVRESGIKPENLSFEITESALYEDCIPLKTIMDKLHSLGCKVDMDDYGAGVSGPSSLTSNSFDMVKLDKSFVDGLGNERVEDMIRATAYMAKKWGMKILAEGVETYRQAKKMVGLGCTLAQGYYYSKPVPQDAYRDLLQVAANLVKNTPRVPIKPRFFSDDVCAVLDGNLLPTYIINPENFVVLYANQALRKYLGADATGSLCYQKMRGRKRPCEECTAMRLFQNGDKAPKEVCIRGKWVLLQASVLMWQEREYIQISCVDITEQKKIAAELQMRSKEYEVIVQQNITGVVRYDIAAGTAVVNVDKELNKVEEYTVEDYVQRICRSGMIQEEDIPAVREMFEDITSGRPSKGYEFGVTLEQGGHHWCHAEYALMKDEYQRPYRALISFLDRTKQKNRGVA